jgi:hypothetical protein
MNKLYITSEQYAAAKDICLRTLDRWMRGRVIPFVKIGRVVRLDPEKADRALESFERKSVSMMNEGGAE